MFANIDKNKEALPIIEKALAIDPNHADAREHKALAIEKLGEKE
jgi:Tfp pilus assembly protein PilF